VLNELVTCFFEMKQNNTEVTSTCLGYVYSFEIHH